MTNIHHYQEPSLATVQVGIGDMHLSSNATQVITTRNLGSCLGVTLYDPAVRVGGMLHALLPESLIEESGLIENPWRFVDMALPLFLSSAYRLGARREHAQIMLFGCAAISKRLKEFQVGARNLQTACNWLDQRGITYRAKHVGGEQGRSITLDLATGAVWLKVTGQPNLRVSEQSVTAA